MPDPRRVAGPITAPSGKRSARAPGVAARRPGGRLGPLAAPLPTTRTDRPNPRPPPAAAAAPRVVGPHSTLASASRVLLTFRVATLDDVGAIAALQNAAAGALTAKFGEGRWSSLVTERGVAAGQRLRRRRRSRRILRAVRLHRTRPGDVQGRPPHLLRAAPGATRRPPSGRGLTRACRRDGVRAAAAGRL